MRGEDVDRLILPGTVPSVNHMYRNAVVRGRRIRVKTDKAESYYAGLIALTRYWMRTNGWKTTSGKVVLRLWFYFPDNKRRDSHNALKILLDGLEDAGIYKDDKTALPRIMDYEVDRKNPRVEIEFELMQT